jgi:hypothetical protein
VVAHILIYPIERRLDTEGLLSILNFINLVSVNDGPRTAIFEFLSDVLQLLVLRFGVR